MGKVINRLPLVARNLSWLSLDIDGVLTDGKLFYGPEGETHKSFNAQDGQALNAWRRQGFDVVIISGRDSPAIPPRMADLGIRHLFTSVGDKRAQMSAFCEDQGVRPETVAHIGDDLADIPLMAFVGAGLAPANASPETLRAADQTLSAAGGNGAVREAVQLILTLQGRWNPAPPF